MKPGNFYYDVRMRATDSLFYLSKVVLGYKDMELQPHAGMCEFLEDTTMPDGLMVAPRGTFKSTIGTVGRNIWLTLPRPEDHPLYFTLGPFLHILITNAVAGNSQKWLRMIKQHWEQNDLLRKAFPELCPTSQCTWNMKDGLQLNLVEFTDRMIEGETTYEAHGLDTTVVSRHYDVRHHDDPVNSDTVHSPTKRERAKENIKFLESCAKETSLLNQRMVIGTPYAFDDIVTELRDEIPPEHTYWHGAHLLGGGLYAPGLLSEEKLAEKLRKQGSFIYVTQYECDPSAPEQRSFPPNSLQICQLTMSGKLKKPGGEMLDPRGLDLVICVDQATLHNQYSKARSSVVLFGMDSSTNMYALDGLIGNLDPLETIEEIVRLWKNYPVRVIDIENEAYLSTLQFWLEKYCDDNNLWEVAAITQATANPRGMGKENDIHLTLLPFAKKRKFFCSSHLTEFALEWNRFPSSGQPYDGLDTARRARRFLINDEDMTPEGTEDFEEEEFDYESEPEEDYRPHFSY